MSGIVTERVVPTLDRAGPWYRARFVRPGGVPADPDQVGEGRSIDEAVGQLVRRYGQFHGLGLTVVVPGDETP